MASPLGIAGGVFDGINTVSSLVGNILNYLSVKETNRANRELAELSYQQNIAQWERENAYNHPAQQMARLKEAGLNPNLVYGNGSAVQTSAHSPQMSYGPQQAPQLGTIYAGLDSMLMASNINKIQAEEERTRNEAMLLYEKKLTQEQITVYEKARAGIAQLELNVKDEMLANDLAIQASEIAKNNAQADYYTKLGEATEEQKKYFTEQCTKLARENGFFSEHETAYEMKMWAEVIAPYAQLLGGVVHSFNEIRNLFFGIKGGVKNLYKSFKNK